MGAGAFLPLGSMIGSVVLASSLRGDYVVNEITVSTYFFQMDGTKAAQYE
jgi:hypothetical protein